VPFHRPYLRQAEEEAVLRVLRSGWLATGPETAQFEEEFAAYVGAAHAVAVSSCTAAMHLALRAAGIGRGDEVVTTVNTFCATVEAIVHAGARPVLADVEEDTLNISPQQIEAKLTPRTRALLPVDLAGHPCDMDSLRAIAERHGLVVIGDAAHSLSARYRDRPVGSLADLTAFSFYVTKPLSTGEGGMVTTDREDWAERLRVLRLHGMSRDAWRRYESARSWYYEVGELGYKYNLSDLQAALGRAQLRRQEALRRRRAEIAEAYREGLSGVPGVRLPAERPDVTHSWHLFIVRVHDGNGSSLRDRAIRDLADRGVGASVHFIPIHYHPYYARRCRAKPGDFPVAERAFEATLSLPIFPGMRQRDIRKVTDVLKSAIGA
jgi:dTDP-4-amino-4,6-dideoxygalactose transaminase